MLETNFLWCYQLSLQDMLESMLFNEPANFLVMVKFSQQLESFVSRSWTYVMLGARSERCWCFPSEQALWMKKETSLKPNEQLCKGLIKKSFEMNANRFLLQSLVVVRCFPPHVIQKYKQPFLLYIELMQNFPSREWLLELFISLCRDLWGLSF